LVDGEDWGDGVYAHTVNGKTFIKKDIPEDQRGIVSAHEGGHIMRQARYKPYIDFVMRTADQMNVGAPAYMKLISFVQDHRGIDPLNMTPREEEIFYVAIVPYCAARALISSED